MYPSITLQTAYNLLNELEIDMLRIYIERDQLWTGPECKLNALDLGCDLVSFSLFDASNLIYFKQ